MLAFEGHVFSGKGEGKKFVSLPWVSCQILEKLGFAPFEGTLNLRLNKQGMENRKKLEATEGYEVKPQVGYCPGKLFRARIEDVDCAVIVPCIPNYPHDVLEIIASEYLRGYLKLVDGSFVKVSVTF